MQSNQVSDNQLQNVNQQQYKTDDRHAKEKTQGLNGVWQLSPPLAGDGTKCLIYHLLGGKQGSPLPFNTIVFHLLLNLSVAIVLCFVADSSMLHQLTWSYIMSNFRDLQFCIS